MKRNYGERQEKKKPQECDQEKRLETFILVIDCVAWNKSCKFK